MTDHTRISRTASLSRILALAGGFLALLWLNLWFFGLPEVSFVQNDISYYAYHLNDMMVSGNTGVMPEYPMPAVWILAAIYTLGGGWQTWQPLFAGLMIGLTAVVALTLYRPGREQGAWFWVLFTGACGPLIWFRFDLIPAAIVVWACLWMATHPGLAGVLVAVGAAVKLWPALLAAPMAAPRPLRKGGARTRLVAFLFAGSLLAVSSLVAVGWARTSSPLTWQRERGLQMESVPATPLMFLRTFTHDTSWSVFLSEFNAIEVKGPGVGAMLAVSTVLTIGSLVLTAVLTWRLMRRFDEASDDCLDAILLSMLAILLATVVANKTLSPQYIPWLGGPVAVLLTTARAPRLRRHVHVQAIAMVLVAALTQITYPWATQGIMGAPNGQGLGTAALVLRNVLLVAMLVHAVHLSWRSTAQTRTTRGRRAGEGSNDSVSFPVGGTAA